MKFLPLYLTAALLGGCMAASPVQPPAAVGAKQPGHATVRGAIRLASAPYALKALVTENDAKTLARIEVWLDKGTGAVLVGELAGTATEVTLSNLRLDMAYLVTLRAFKDDPETSTTDATLQISDDAHSVSKFNTFADSVGAYQTEIATTFALRLADQTFAGSAGGAIALTPGVLGSTQEPEVLMKPLANSLVAN